MPRTPATRSSPLPSAGAPQVDVGRSTTLPARRCDATVLVLQGGGALGAYQAGAYEALSDDASVSTECLSWVAGISIGAVNAALIAGNPPAHRVERLHAFWNRVTLSLPAGVPLWGQEWMAPWLGPLRPWWDDIMALWGAASGVPGFFRPHPPWRPPLLSTSLYDMAPLRDTLLELVDFERLNDGPVRFSVGAVDIESGNFTYFDNRQTRIGPEHIMASGALPPSFDAVDIDGRAYWDGGLMSNTPLAHIVNKLPHSIGTAHIFQVDLYPARGRRPRNLAEVAEREKDIRYSSRTRMVTDLVRERYATHARLRALAERLPAAERASAEVQALLAGTDDPTITLLHLIHRGKGYQSGSKDYEFSALSMREHWRAGRRDMADALTLLANQPPAQKGEFRVFDAHPDPHQPAPHRHRRPLDLRLQQPSTLDVLDDAA